VLCAWCWQKLVDVVDYAIPAVVQHLRVTSRVLSVASSTPPSEMGATGADPANGSVLHPAWVAADELESDLMSWAMLVLDESPAAVRGPNSAPWHGDVSRWLSVHMAWIAGREWAPEMRRELCSTVATLRARWPLAEDSERHREIPDVRCPRCDRIALWFYPAQWHRQPFVVACQNPECGRIFDEHEWSRLVGLLAQAERRIGA
jgi:hypothetical protein